MRTASIYFVLSAFSLGFSAAAPIAAPDSSNYSQPGTLTGPNGSPLNIGPQVTNNNYGSPSAPTSWSTYGGAGGAASAPGSYYGAGSGGSSSSAGNYNGSAGGSSADAPSDVSVPSTAPISSGDGNFYNGAVPNGGNGVTTTEPTFDENNLDSNATVAQKVGVGIVGAGVVGGTGYGIYRWRKNRANKKEVAALKAEAAAHANSESGAHGVIDENGAPRKEAPKKEVPVSKAVPIPHNVPDGTSPSLLDDATKAVKDTVTKIGTKLADNAGNVAQKAATVR